MPTKFNLKLILWLTFLVGTAIGLFLQFTYHKFLNFDTLAYINIAELYAKDNLKDAEILPGIKHSDHCPVYLEVDI